MNQKSEIKSRSHQQFQNLLVTLLLSTAIQAGYAASGDVDLSFDPGSDLNSTVTDIALQDDDKILIGGAFTTVHGAMRSGIARLNADGSLDDSFLIALTGPGAGYIALGVSPIFVQEDGKIVIAGGFTSVNGAAITNIARLNADGSLDSSFKFQFGSASNCSAMLQSDGKILLMGGEGSVYGATIARFYDDGTQDNSFHADPLLNTWQGIKLLALQNNGKMIVVGSAGVTTPGVSLGTCMIEGLNADGSADDSFHVNITSTELDIRSIAVQSDGKILLGGWFQKVNGVARTNLCRLNSDGSLDPTFLNGMSGLDNRVLGMAIQPDGKILIGGWFKSVNGIQRPYLARLNTDGSSDLSFLNGMAGVDGLNPAVYAFAVQSDGKILIRGSFWSFNGVGRPGFARLNADGSLDGAFLDYRNGPNNGINALAVQSDGKVLIAGRFNFIDGIARTNLARLNADGSLDGSFVVSLAADFIFPLRPMVQCLGVQRDNKVLIGGNFTNINAATRGRIARLNPDGSLDDSFKAAVGVDLYGNNDQVSRLVLQDDGKILVRGMFTTVNGVARTNFVRLNPDGSLDASFNSPIGTDSYVGSFALQPDGKIVVAGYSAPSGGLMRKGLIRLQVNGALDSSFLNGQSGVVRDLDVVCVAVQPDGKILVGGLFSSVDGVARTGIARLNCDGSLDGSFHDGLTGMASGVNAIALQDDGKVLVTLTVSAGDGMYPTNLARLNADGSLDRDFLVGQSGPNVTPSQLIVQSDGRIVIGGGLTAVNQIARGYVVRLIGDYAPPKILSLPQSATAEAGTGISLPMHVSGSPPLTYQWFFNETNRLDGCTNRCLELPGIPLRACGAYTLVAGNACGAVTSAPVVLNVIPPVERRLVPALDLLGETGSSLNVEYADALGSPANWLPLDTVDLTAIPQLYLDVSAPLPPQRFYRVWQTGTPAVPPSLNLPFLVPAITLTGNMGDQLRLDYINQFGPTNAWVNLDTVTLTNTSQLYFDTSAPTQPRRLYRIVPVP